ncbi:aldose epimerase family protein [uncultured Flavonifractor sp.]|uniref:aldose epimerase family protein n=1 Tax=uncultured Flavonifractor sp. TaxID=1193534 RepID=UPI002628010E|nr:aldose epimerase family protein [uncultured Flavonifractor sp.]
MAELTWQPFGLTRDRRQVELWTLRAGRYAAQVLTYGGILRAFTVPAEEGERDIVLGCETLADYERQDKYLGALVGRVANRIGGAAFALNGTTYQLAANNGPNCLHGGLHGFHQAVWKAREEHGALVLTHVSPDGEEGFPGALWVQVTYTLTADGVLTLDYRGESTADTLCNLTNHSYFNLLGHASGSLAGQQIQVWADAITQTDATSVPTGVLLPVEGTPFDLRRPVDFLQGLAMTHPQLTLGNGYDHNFVLSRQPRAPMGLAARVTGGGLCLACYTTQPGLQLYTANYLDGTPGKGGVSYGPRSAFCLETQAWPDAIHHPDFPTVVLRAGESYRHTTAYRVTAV